MQRPKTKQKKKRKHQHELLCGRCTQRPYKKSRSSVGTRHAVSEKRAKLTQAKSETGIKRTRHAVSLHSQTKGRPSSPPVSGGEWLARWEMSRNRKALPLLAFYLTKRVLTKCIQPPQIKTLFCPQYSHTLVYSILTPLYIVLSRPCPREDCFERSQRR